jgi:ABC-2 type transport system permease protein
MLGVGAVAYGLEIRAATLAAAAVAFLVGSATFASLGLALAALSPTAEAAPAIANFTILPLAFVSDVFISLADPPAWLDVVGDVFPLKPFVVAFQAPFVPFSRPPAFEWHSILVMALWGIGGALIALRFFGWDPRRVGGRRRAARRS